MCNKLKLWGWGLNIPFDLVIKLNYTLTLIKVEGHLHNNYDLKIF